MKKKLLFISLWLFAASMFAQVGINTTTPDPSAALDVSSTSQGVLLPRMTTDQKTAIVNPATGLLVYDTNTQCISQNAGTPASPQWVCLSLQDNQSKSFYMPSVAIDASALVTGQSLDLYNVYKTQFGTPSMVSDRAPASIPYFPVATDLFYYITYYNNAVLKINAISVDGKMNYDIIQTADYSSFMNVVFVIK